jgi:hypothetical protein
LLFVWVCVLCTKKPNAQKKKTIIAKDKVTRGSHRSGGG